MSRLLFIVVLVTSAACTQHTQSGGSPALESLFLPLGAASGACSLSAINPHAMDAYPSNPHVSGDETFLNVMAVMGGESFPRTNLREAGAAFYGVPVTEAGISVYRFTDQTSANAAARALSAHPRQQGVFQKGVVVAVAWQSVGSGQECLATILRHLQNALT